MSYYKYVRDRIVIYSGTVTVFQIFILYSNFRQYDFYLTVKLFLVIRPFGTVYCAGHIQILHLIGFYIHKI